jgi:PAS domain S-box-containing protein/putative nucleotidyltransferase with HDIG domain
MPEKKSDPSVDSDTNRDQIWERLQVGELRYHQLFNEMVDGFALHEIICDDEGIPQNYRFLEINPAFEQLTGLKAEALIGRTVLEVMPEIEPEWIETYGQVALTGKATQFENYSQELGRYYSVKAYCPEPGKFATIFSDITKRKRSQHIIELRMRLLEFATTHSLDELLQKTLDEVETLTESQIGFYHFVEPDQETLSLQAWSTRTLDEFCTAEGNGLHYPVSEAGVWADCVHSRQPVVHNDYASIPDRKGLPEGHAHVVRELIVPIFRKERIVAILGVGNKPQVYTQEDIELVSYLADVAWELVERKQAEKRIQESEEKYRSLFENVPDGVYRTTPDGQFLAVNPTFLRMFGFESADALEQKNAFNLYVNWEDRQTYIAQLAKTGKVQNMEVKFKRKDGQQFTALDNGLAVHDEYGNILYYEGTLTDISDRIAVEEDLEFHRRELERLYRASSSLLLTPSNDIDSLAQAIVETVFTEFNHSNCSILLVEEGITVLRHVASVGEFIEMASEKILDLNGPGLIPESIRTGKILNAPDVLSEENYIPSWENARSELIVPLKVGERLLGVIDVQSAQQNAFSDDDERLMSIFAERAAMALERTELYVAEQRRVARLDALQHLGTELASLRSERDVLAALVKQGAALADSPTCSVMLIDEDTNEAFLVAQEGLQGEALEGLRIPLELPLVKESLSTGDPIIIANIDRDVPAFRQVLVHSEIRAFYAFPLIMDGRVRGYLTLSSLQPRVPSEAESTTYELLAKLAAASLENVRLLEQTQRNLKRLAALRVADVAIASSFELAVTLDVLLDQVISQLQVDAADILVHEPNDHRLKYARGKGFRTQALRYTKLRFGEGFAGRAALERRMIKAYDLKRDSHEFHRSTLIVDEGFVAYWCVPLLAKGVVKGVLEVFSRELMVPNQEWFDFLEVLAGQAAIAIDNAELYNNLQRSNTELFLAYDNTLEGWANALELRDKETEGHARRVTNLTTRLAKQMGIKDEDMIYVRWGALLHDIGKMGIPDDILLKSGKLTEEEWVIMRKHPEYALKMLSSISYLERALEIPYCHHEKWDGSGYPRGLEGDDIPLVARIFTIIDVWDALSSDRPYRKAWPKEKVFDYIHEQAGSHFDPDVVDAFFELLSEDDE